MLRKNEFTKITCRWFLTILAMGFFLKVDSQPAVFLSIENEIAADGNYYFDIYLHTNAANVYLGNADFIFSFNNNNFDNPTLQKVGSGTGFCTFKPSDSNPQNDENIREDYFDDTHTMINSSTLVINLNGPTPDAQGFDSKVAKIDAVPGTHRLGRFMITGLLVEDVNLKWKTDGILSTHVYHLDPSSLLSSAIGFITCLDKLTVSTWLPESDYQANRIKAMGMAPSGSNISLKGSQSIELAPGFTAEQNAELQILIQGCQE